MKADAAMAAPVKLLVSPPSVMVPFTSRVVPVVDLEAGRLVIDPPEGLFDDRPIEAEKDE